MSDDKAHEYVPFHGILSMWPGDWRERAEKAEAERNAALARVAELERERDRLARTGIEWCERATAHLTQSQSLRAQLDKWQSIALDSVRGGGQKHDTSERLKREADASHALSSYTVSGNGDDVLFERNNLAEALREVNARLVQVTAERDAARRWAKAWKAKAKSVRKTVTGMFETVIALSAANVDCRAERDVERLALDEANANLGRARDHGNWWRAKHDDARNVIGTLSAKLNQQRNEARVAFDRDFSAVRDALDRTVVEFVAMRAERDAALARAEKCEHERALSQHLREDDHR